MENDDNKAAPAPCQHQMTPGATTVKPIPVTVRRVDRHAGFAAEWLAGGPALADILGLDSPALEKPSRIDAIKRAVAAGTYPTPHVQNVALDRLFAILDPLTGTNDENRTTEGR